MDADILLFANPQDSSTKSLIIRMLAAHGPLSTVRIQNGIKKSYGRNVSYQAIRQAVQELSDSGVLERIRKLYSVRSSWVYDLKDLVKMLEKAVMDQKKIKSVDRTTTQLQVKNLYEMGFFILFSLEDKYFDLTRREVYLQLHHLWIPFSDYNKRQALKKLLTRLHGKVVVRGKSIGDKMLASWYRKCGAVKLGATVSADCEYIVQGETVVQIYVNEKLKKKMDEVYSLKNVFKKNLFEELNDITYTPYGIHIVITRNAEIAQELKKQMNAHFK